MLYSPSLHVVTSMETSSIFVDELTEPVQLIHSAADSPGNEKSTEVHQFRSLEQLQSYFADSQGQNSSDYFISICQRNSWAPLQITKPMLRFLVERFNLGLSTWDIASCFYARSSDIESVFCVPLTRLRNGKTTEISYTIRYPEFKSSQQTWVIRQTGVFQKFDTETSSNLFILFNPMPTSEAHRRAQTIFENSKNPQRNLFWLHQELFATYTPAWRHYNVHLEKLLLPMADNAVVTFVEELTTTERRHITDLAFIEGRLMQAPIILGFSGDVLKGLCSICSEHSRLVDTQSTASMDRCLSHLEEYRRDCEAYNQVALYLQQRAQKVTQHLAITLSFREQLDARSQNETMLCLSRSAVFVTTLTLVYLPSSFVATFFGMNFFDFDESNHFVATPEIWIYVISSVLLTTGTFLVYDLLLGGNSSSHCKEGLLPVIKRLVSFRGLKQSSDIELGSF